MAFEIITSPSGYCLADDIFYYKVKDTLAAALSNATWTLILRDSSGNEYEYQYISVFLPDKTTYINVSEMVRALAAQLRNFPEGLAFALRSLVEVSINITSASGNYIFDPCRAILGKYSSNEKDFAPVNGEKLFFNFIGPFYDLKCTNKPLQYALNNSKVLFSFYNLNNTSFLLRLDFYSNLNFVKTTVLDLTSIDFDENLYTINYLYDLGDLSEDNITTINAYLAKPPTSLGSEVQFIRVLYQPETDNRRVFVFRNKKGGAQVLHTNGEETIKTGFSSQLLDGTFSEKDYNQRNKPLQTRYNTSDETIYETTTGYMTKPQFDNILDIFGETDVWLYENGKYVAVELMNEASEKFDNNNGLFYAKLLWKYAHR